MTIGELKKFIKKANLADDVVVIIPNADLITEAMVLESRPFACPANYDGQVVKSLFIGLE